VGPELKRIVGYEANMKYAKHTKYVNIKDTADHGIRIGYTDFL